MYKSAKSFAMWKGKHPLNHILYVSLYLLFLIWQNYRNGENAAYVEEGRDMDVAIKSKAMNLPDSWAGVFFNWVSVKGLVPVCTNC